MVNILLTIQITSILVFACLAVLAVQRKRFLLEAKYEKRRTSELIAVQYAVNDSALTAVCKSMKPEEQRAFLKGVSVAKKAIHSIQKGVISNA